MPIRVPKIIDISLALDAAKFKMRTYAGFTKDMQFEVETLKDYPGGLGQIVRGAHMRLHAGTHVDAPSHMVEGGKQIHDLALDTFIGDAVVADVRHRGGNQAITTEDLQKTVGGHLRGGDRVLLRTDINKEYDGSEAWMGRAPYLSYAAIDWCHAKGVSIVGFDFYHATKAPNEGPADSTSRKLLELGILTMPYLTNLGAISQPRVTLIALPLRMINVEASPVRAVVLEE